MALSEQRLRSQHFPMTVTEEYQTDYQFWTAHDEEGHAGFRYGSCPWCAEKWELWWKARSGRD